MSRYHGKYDHLHDIDTLMGFSSLLMLAKTLNSVVYTAFIAKCMQRGYLGLGMRSKRFFYRCYTKMYSTRQLPLIELVTKPVSFFFSIPA